MRVAEAVGRALAGLGADHVFGVVGSGNFHVDQRAARRRGPFVAARHEGGAATMADAYARISGRVGVLTVHQGCGLTNAMTGIAEAAKSRTPLLVLAADTAPPPSAPTSGSTRRRWPTAVGAVPERVHTPGGASTTRSGRTGGRRAAAHRRAQPAAGRPGRDRRRAGAAARGARAAPPVRRRARSRSSAELLAAAERPVFLAGPRRRRAGARAAGARRPRPARCWPPRRSRTGSSPATLVARASPAASPPRWPPS